MNMDQFQLILAKLTTFSENLPASGPTRAIDRDMLKRYIQDLYDAVPAVSNSNGQAKEQKNQYQNHEQEVVSAVHTKLQAEQFTHTPNSDLTMAAEQSADVPSNATAKIEAMAEKEVLQQQVTSEQNVEDIEEMENLMNEMLAEGPSYAIPKTNASFKKVFGLNDKFQITSVLFDGNNDVFLTCLEALDSATSLDEAKSILAPYAKQYDWSNPSKEKVVRSFIQTVAKKFS